MKIEKRDEKIKALIDKGISYRNVGEMFNLTGSRIHQIYNSYKCLPKSIHDRIIERDNYKCQWGEVCEKDSKLQVHHINRDSSNNRFNNLITLCTKCHYYFHTNFGERGKTREERQIKYLINKYS